MAVNNTPIKLLLLFLLVFSNAHADESGMGVRSQIIIEYAKQEVMVKTAELGERISLCEKRRDSAVVPDVNYEELKKLGLTRQQVIKALSHLSVRNFTVCEEGAREALAYALGTLSMFANKYNVDIESLQGIENNLIYPSSRDIESAIEFSKLKNEARKLLIGAVGDHPFNLVKTLQMNNLTVE
jgi:hypothetical protein